MPGKGKGWHGERKRHSLARRGIPTTSEPKRVQKGVDHGKLLIEGNSDLEKLAREIQDRNYDHYGDADIQEVVEALADVPEFGDPEMLYEARERFRQTSIDLLPGSTAEDRREVSGWGHRIEGLIAEYEQWLEDEGLEREEILPLRHGARRYTSPHTPNPYRERPKCQICFSPKHLASVCPDRGHPIKLPGPGPDVDELV